MKFREPFTLIGNTPSPYTRKLVALLRYRRISYKVIWGDLDKNLGLLGVEPPKVKLLPTCIVDREDGNLTPICDTTPIIRQLEKQYKTRKVIPNNSVVAFLDYLVEDYADEWWTKFMFHYRWYPQEDAKNASQLLPILQEGVDLPSEKLSIYSDYIYSRQVSRLHVVGSSESTADLIEQSYLKALIVLEKHFEKFKFIFGSRPSASDFAIYGQLSQLIGFDPTPRAIAHKVAPRVVAWTSIMEDQCGFEPKDDDWNVDLSSSSLRELLKEIGSTYVPALLKNASAFEKDEKEWSASINGATWSQNTFAYQAKCFKWIRDEYDGLSRKNRDTLLQVLDGTGCEKLFF